MAFRFLDRWQGRLRDLFPPGGATDELVATLELRDRSLEAWADGIDGERRTYTVSWTSTGTQPAIGNGTLDGWFRRRGDDVSFHFRLIPGSTTTFGTGTYFFGLPVETGATTRPQPVIGWVQDVSTAFFWSVVGLVNTSSSNMTLQLGDGTINQVGQTVPMTWASGDPLYVSGQYTVGV